MSDASVERQAEDVTNEIPGEDENATGPDVPETGTGVEETTDLEEAGGVLGVVEPEKRGDEALGMGGEGSQAADTPDAGEEATAFAAPYVYWNVVDEDGTPVEGATFRIQGPRTGGENDNNNSNWNSNQNRLVKDCVGDTVEDCADQRDKNPNAGEFLVNYIGNSTTSGALVDPTKRYRLQMETPPEGYAAVDPQGWILVPQAQNTPNVSDGDAWVDGAYGFGTFVVQKVSHTVTVRKGDIRTAITGAQQVNIASDYAEGSRFGLFKAIDGDTPEAECITEISTTFVNGNPVGECVFEDFAGYGTWYVGELEPVVGSPAAENYSAPIDNVITMAASAPRFTERPYRYAVELSATEHQSVNVPSDPTSGNGQLTSSGRFMNVLKNPELNYSCEAGINVGIVIDLSSSVQGSENQLKNATNGFINALKGTGSNVALTSFGRNSPRQSGAPYNTQNTDWMSVDNPENLQILRSTINQYVNVVKNGGSQGTNWDIGFWTSTRPSNPDFVQPDLTIIITDGNPTYSGNASGTGRPISGAGDITTFRELERGIASANLIKSKDTRVLVYGVGRANDKEMLEQNLAAISGPTAWTPEATSLNAFDYANVNWSELEGLLRDIATQMSCTANVEVHKVTQINDEEPEAANGWDFTLSKTGEQGIIIGDAKLTTGASESDDPGQASWTVSFDQYNAKAGTITLAETPQNDWTLQSVDCTVDGNSVQGTLSGNAVTLEDGLKVGQSASCVFTNVRTTDAKLTLVKEVINEPFNGTAADTDWTLSATQDDENTISGVTGSGDVTSHVVRPGKWTLAERVTIPTDVVASEGYDWTDLVCVNADDEVIEGVSKDDLDLQVDAGDDITCTFTNTAKPGSVAWQKTDESGSALGGSEWTLVGHGEAEDPGVVDYTEFITENPAGTFTVSADLPWGSYTLTEVKAPTGYLLLEDPIEFRIGPDAEGDGSFSAGDFHLAVDLGPQENVQRQGPGLPLTGGQSAAMFTILGLVIAGGAAGGAAVVARKRRSA